MFFRKKDTRFLVHVKGTGENGEVIDFRVKTTFDEACKIVSQLMQSGKVRPLKVSPAQPAKRVTKQNGVAFPNQVKGV